MCGTRSSRSPNQAGQIVFYLLVVLPLVASLTVLTVDVSRWRLLRAQAQAEADRIAIAAAHFLPDIEAAERYIIDSVASLNEFDLLRNQQGDPQLAIRNNQLHLVLVASQELNFSFLLPNGRSNEPLLVQEEATAQLVPGDYVIVFSDSSDLGPQPFRAWGSKDVWPAASYFNLVSSPFKGKEYPRWATQQCFNPVYSALKSSIIELVDSIQSVATNRLALISSPGGGVSTAGSLLTFASGEDSFVGFQFLQRLRKPLRPLWSDWFEPALLSSDEACVYLSDPDTSREGTYTEPKAPIYTISKQSSPTPCQRYRLGFPYLDHLPNGNLRPCFLRDLTTRSLVHYHSLRRAKHDRQGGSIAAAIRVAFAELVSAESASQLRGAVATRARRRVLVFSDTLPTMTREIRELLAAKIEVVLVGYTHPAIDNYQEHREILEAQQQELEKIEGLEVRIADGPVELGETVLRLIAKHKEVVLKS